MNSPSRLKLLLVGATGAVGQCVLRQALLDSRVAQVIAPTRRALPAAEKLLNPIVDFSRLPDQADWWAADAVICTLGTTIKVAGSKEAFARVDRDWPIDVGRRARSAGATRYALNSSLGTTPKTGNFYLRTKAEAEAGIEALGYPSLTIVRPSLIDAEREEQRPGEAITLMLIRPLNSLIPRRYRAVTPEQIAKALLAGALQGKPGKTIIESEQLHA